MSHDIRDILNRLVAIESQITPVAVKHGLNAQQKSADQLPALFKPKKISVLKSKTDPQHPMDGMAVGSNESKETEKESLEEAMSEIEEDMLSKVKKDLTQYLDKLEKKVKVDRELKDKAVDAIEKGQTEEDDEVKEDPTTQDSESESPPAPVEDPTLPETAPVKTFALEDGSCLECWGDEKKGFEIRHGGKSLPTRFPNIDQASMAVDLFKRRRKSADTNQDYLEEK